MTIAIAIYGIVCLGLGILLGIKIGQYILIKKTEPLMEELKKNVGEIQMYVSLLEANIGDVDILKKTEESIRKAEENVRMGKQN